MNKEEMYELAQGVIAAGFENESSADDIKMDMMAAKIPFSKLNSLYREITIADGLVVDPKIVTSAILEKVETVDWENIEDWTAFSGIAESIADATDGATPARVVTIARAYAKEELDLALPKKPKGSGGTGRVGAIALAVTELFAANKAPTKQEFYDAMIPVVGGDQQHANIIYYMGLHLSVCTAVANEESLVEVTKRLAQEANPTPGAGVSAIPRGGVAEAEEVAEAAGEFDDDEEEMAA